MPEPALLDKGIGMCIGELASRGDVPVEGAAGRVDGLDVEYAGSADYGPVRAAVGRRMATAADERRPGLFWRTWVEEHRTVFGELVVRLDVGGSRLVCTARVEPQGKGAWDMTVTKPG